MEDHFLTWEIAHEEVKALFPMSQDTLKAIMHECLMPGMSAGTIRNLWSAIEDGHRQFGYTPPWRCTEETSCATAEQWLR